MIEKITSKNCLKFAKEQSELCNKQMSDSCTEAWLTTWDFLIQHGMKITTEKHGLEIVIKFLENNLEENIPIKYKLIKDYPTCINKVGDYVPYTTGYYSKFPEFWEPIY